MLEKEYKYYQKHQKEFLEKYKDKVLVIKDEDIIGIYDTEEQAYEESVSKHKLGTFLIQKCIPQEEAIQTFHSRVIFN